MSCPKCDSEIFIKIGFAIRKGGIRLQKYQCKAEGCGHVWNDKEEVKGSEKQ